MILKNIKNKAPKKPKPEPKMLFKHRKDVNLKLYINMELESWGPVSAFVTVLNGKLSIKNIELLQDTFIDLNDGNSFLEYRNLSTKDIEALKKRCSYVITGKIH